MTPNIEEILHYLGAQNAPESLRDQVNAVLKNSAAVLYPKYIYRVFDLDFQSGQPSLKGTALTLPGKMAKNMLCECTQAVLLACTLGTRFDLALAAMQARDMAAAVILDACGSACVESGCEQAEQELSLRFPNCFFTDRFSPGYGDLPLLIQPKICTLLDVSKRLGIFVGESLLMKPMKSVTAIIGLSDKPQMARIRGCEHCRLKDTCTLRKGGKRCGA